MKPQKFNTTKIFYANYSNMKISQSTVMYNFGGYTSSICTIVSQMVAMATTQHILLHQPMLPHIAAETPMSEQPGVCQKEF